MENTNGFTVLRRQGTGWVERKHVGNFGYEIVEQSLYVYSLPTSSERVKHGEGQKPTLVAIYGPNGWAELTPYQTTEIPNASGGEIGGAREVKATS